MTIEGEASFLGNKRDFIIPSGGNAHEDFFGFHFDLASYKEMASEKGESPAGRVQVSGKLLGVDIKRDVEIGKNGTVTYEAGTTPRNTLFAFKFQHTP